MRLRSRAPGSILALCFVFAACASSGPSGDSSGVVSDAKPSVTPQRAVPMVLRVEPPGLNDRLDRMGLGYPLITSSLAFLDDRLVPQALLAERLPSQADSSWTVNSDGTMKTTYRLRSDLRWRDGNPLTAGDFAFAHYVYMDREVPVTTRLPENLMSEVAAIDDRTLQINWNQPYVEANALVGSQLAP